MEIKKTLEMGIIAIIAFYLRVINLEFYPRWYTDEGTNIQMGLNMIQGRMGFITWGPNFFPPLYDFLVALLLNVFGNNYFVARLLGVIMGTLSSILIYIIASRLYNRTVGILSALLLSVAGIYINRMVLSYNAIEFFFLLTIIFYIKLRETNNRKWSLLTGMSAGLSFLSSYLGIISIIFLLLQSIIDKNINKIKPGIFIFSILSLIYPLLGLMFGWDWFIYDIFYQTSRSYRLDHLFTILFLGSPPYNDRLYIGDELLYPSYIFSLLGFLSIFYLAFSRKKNDIILNAIICIIMVSIIAGSIWWSYLIVIYPLYSLGTSIMLYEMILIKRSPLVTLLFSLVLVPYSIIEIPALVNYSKLIFILIFLAGSSYIFYERFNRYNFLINISKFILFFLTITMFIVASFFNIDPINNNYISDQLDVVNYLNSHTTDGDLIAINPSIIPLLKNGGGIDYFQQAFYNGKNSQFLYEDTDMLSRFKMNLNYWNFKYIVIDSFFSIHTYNYNINKMITIVKSKWLPVFNSGDYTIYLNPNLAQTKILWEDEKHNYDFGYNLNTKNQKITSEGNATIFSTVPIATYGYSFWNIYIGNLETSTENVFFKIRYKTYVDDSLERYQNELFEKETIPEVRIAVKFLDLRNREIKDCEWFIDGPSISYKIGIYIYNCRTMPNSIIVGMDSFTKSNVNYKLYIDYMSISKIVERK